MEAAGIEREEPPLEGVIQQEVTESVGDVSPLCLHSESNDRQRLAADDAILRRVIRCWPALSEETRTTIDAIIVDHLLFEE
ncbi:MAG: hypothetical protein R3C10_04125 [Pirellulales bacterium]